MRPVTATMRPVMAMERRAKNLKNMKPSPMRVASFVDKQLRRATRVRARREMPFSIQIILGLVFEVDVELGEKARTMYSPKMMAMMAAEPGLRTKTEDHVKRKPKRSPKILER